MKTKILELIDKKIESYTQTLNTGEILAFQELRQEIEKMEEWIPVTERLPENDKIVLGITKNGNYVLDVLLKGEFYYYEGFIAHWQPLPLPPHP